MSRLPATYFAARDQFRSAATSLNWTLQSYAIQARGPAGEELTIDVAASPGVAESPVLLLSSGVHGAEGFFGSAVQLEALRQFTQQPLPQSIRCVMIHAVSPFGFAHRRRFDENNVDPNRNFLLPDQDYSGSPPLYDLCDPILNPKHPPRWPDGFLWHTVRFILRHGYAELKQAIAGGQYDYPRGIFYGGAEPSESSQILLKQFPEWLAAAQRVLHLDFHTGLGKWANYKLLVDPPLSPSQREAANRWFGAANLQDASPLGIDYHTRGGFGDWCRFHNSGRDYLYLCAEFGTYGAVRVLRAIRRENQATHWAEPGSAVWESARASLKEAFAPESTRWREAVLNQAASLIQQAVRGLC